MVGSLGRGGSPVLTRLEPAFTLRPVAAFVAIELTKDEAVTVLSLLQFVLAENPEDQSTGAWRLVRDRLLMGTQRGGLTLSMTVDEAQSVELLLTEAAQKWQAEARKRKDLRLVDQARQIAQRTRTAIGEPRTDESAPVLEDEP